MKNQNSDWALSPVHHALLAVLKIVSLALLLGLLGCKHAEKAAEDSGPKVEGNRITMAADAPEKGSIAVEEVNLRTNAVTRLTGRLTWNDNTTVRIFSPVAGHVETILADVGRSVAEGDPLARIASPDFGQVQADARRAAGDLQLAERALARVRELHEHGAAARKDVESAEADYTRAVSEKDRTVARLTLYGGADGSFDQMFSLKAPLPGVIVEKNINPGQEVRSDQMLANAPQLFAPLFVVTDPAKLWVQLDVTELEAPTLKSGQLLKIYSQAFPDRTFEGRLENIGSSLDPNTRTVRVRGEVANPNQLLKAEMFVTVDAVTEVSAETKSGVTVSANAVFLRDNQHYVFVENQPGQYERRSVKLGSEIAGQVLITDGLAVGQKVVTDGCLLLQALIDSDAKS
ncbi:MAG: Efflux transporter, family, subunit [Pedosphaera sp.]|nr:Efflux transporter, family, subunit [Pedosphaera sp.]